MNETKTYAAFLSVLAWLELEIIFLMEELAKAGMLNRADFMEKLRAARQSYIYKEIFAQLGEHLQGGLKDSERIPEDADLQYLIDRMRWPKDSDEHEDDPDWP